MYIRPAAIITLLILLWSLVAPAQTWGAPAAPGLQAPASATADAPEHAIYRVRIDAAEPLRAHVSAELPVREGRIWMLGWGAEQHPRGWASFVEDLRASDADGRDVPLTTGEGAQWHVSNTQAQRLSLSYVVNLEFAKAPWPAGNEQAALFRDGALYTVTKALFIASDGVAGSIVSFDVPPSWKVSTPWESDPGGRIFSVRSRDDLVENSLVLGAHTERVFTFGNFRCTMALMGSMAEGEPLLSEVVGRVIAYYGQVFPRTPPSRYLLTLFLAGERDAEAFRQSCAISEPWPPDRQGLPLWGSTVAHELFHAWNGHAIRAEDYASTQWFSEGFTEYFANLALVRTGLVTEDEFLEKASRNLSLYLFFRWSPAFSAASLKEAGARKGFYRLGVYNGGWAVAFCLDTALVEESHGRRSLADVMRVMYDRYGLTATNYPYAGLVDAVASVSGRDMAPFFDRYVSGREVLPVQECLARLGLKGYGEDYSAELYVYRDETAGAPALQARRLLLHGR
jgi:predicted metalloprotease with PDZ domain